MKKYFLFFILLVISSLFITGCISGISTKISNAYNGEIITIPLSDISTTAKYYSYDSKGIAIRYFSVLDSAGKPKIAFDGCDICGGAKGYRQEGTDMVCNNCGQHFKIDQLGTKNSGVGCWPGYLPSSFNSEIISIKVSDIIGGEDRFV